MVVGFFQEPYLWAWTAKFRFQLSGRNPQANVEGGPVCYLCGGQGHLSKSCPARDLKFERDVLFKAMNLRSSGAPTWKSESREQCEVTGSGGKKYIVTVPV